MEPQERHPAQPVRLEILSVWSQTCVTHKTQSHVSCLFKNKYKHQSVTKVWPVWSEGELTGLLDMMLFWRSESCDASHTRHTLVTRVLLDNITTARRPWNQMTATYFPFLNMDHQDSVLWLVDELICFPQNRQNIIRSPSAPSGWIVPFPVGVIRDSVLHLVNLFMNVNMFSNLSQAL